MENIIKEGGSIKGLMYSEEFMAFYRTLYNCQIHRHIINYYQIVIICLWSNHNLMESLSNLNELHCN